MFRLKSVNAMSAGKVSGLLYAALAVLFIPFFLIVALLAPKADNQPSTVVFVMLAIIAPFLYGAMGFLFGAGSAWVYNLAAGWIGGIEIQLEGTSPQTIALLSPKLPLQP
jgi:cyanate permease